MDVVHRYVPIVQICRVIVLPPGKGQCSFNLSRKKLFKQCLLHYLTKRQVRMMLTDRLMAACHIDWAKNIPVQCF